MMNGIVFQGVTADELKQIISTTIAKELESLNKEPKEVMTIDEVSKFLKVTKMTLQNWKKKGKLMPMVVGSVVRYRRDEVLRFCGWND